MYVPPPAGSVGEPEPIGDSYGAVLLRGGVSRGGASADRASGDGVLADGGDHREAVVEVLRGIRFTGWIAPPEDGWTVVVGRPGAGVVASARRGIVEVGGLLAERTGAAVVAVRVRRDRQLALVAWRGGEELARYVSDPSQEPGSDREVLSDPLGDEGAPVFAELCGRPDAAEDLEEMLAEELDTDSVFESERLTGVLRLLGLPSWLVAVPSLPKDVPTGPRAATFTRLTAGRTGAGAIVPGIATRRFRRDRTPPPVIEDPPRSNMSGIEPWML